MKNLKSNFLTKSNEIFLAEEERKNQERYEKFLREKKKIEKRRKLFLNTTFQVYGFIFQELFKKHKITPEFFESDELKEAVNAVKDNLEKYNKVSFSKLTENLIDSAVEILKAEVNNSVNDLGRNKKNLNMQEPEWDFEEIKNTEPLTDISDNG